MAARLKPHQSCAVDPRSPGYSVDAESLRSSCPCHSNTESAEVGVGCR